MLLCERNKLRGCGKGQMISIPLFGITYGLTGIASLLAEFRKRGPLQAAGIVLIFVSAINAYSEEGGFLKRLDIAIPLLLGFLWAYTLLSMRLMKQVGIDQSRTAFVQSFLPVVYVLTLAFVPLLANIVKGDENPPLTLYICLSLILVIHVPVFAFGVGRAIQGSGHSNLPSYTKYIRRPFVTLGIPLLACTVIQVLDRNDWRLLGSNIVVTIVLVLLFLIARPRVCTEGSA